MPAVLPTPDPLLADLYQRSERRVRLIEYADTCERLAGIAQTALQREEHLLEADGARAAAAALRLDA